MKTDGDDDWISLGDLTGITCIARANECEMSDRVTILLWIKMSNCGSICGIISSFGEWYTPGFGLRYIDNKIR